jgi:hypothetical protein
MKKLITGMAMGTLLASAILAQGGTHTPPDPATMAAREVKHLTALLTLTTAQQAAATTAFTQEFTALAGYEATLRTDEKALRAAVEANNTTNINSLAAGIGTLQGEILTARSLAEGAFYTSLSTTQQAALKASGGFGRGFGGPGGRGGFGGHGGPPPPGN